MEAAACARAATGYTYARREPEKAALFQVLQRHLLTFEQEWTDNSDGHTRPSFVTDELHDFLACGVLARGSAQLFCKTCQQVVERASKRILRFLQRREVITLATAPCDGEVILVTDETLAEKDPLLARLAGPAHKRAPVLIVLDPDATSMAKGKLRGQLSDFNLQAATQVATNDNKGREDLCKYILRPPLANDRLAATVSAVARRTT